VGTGMFVNMCGGHTNVARDMKIKPAVRQNLPFQLDLTFYSFNYLRSGFFLDKFRKCISSQKWVNLPQKT
jgi:hypothetical protein